MEKVQLIVSIEQAKLDALNYALSRKGGDTVQKELEKRVREMYDELVPEELRGYVEYQISPQPKRSSRPRKTTEKPKPAGMAEPSENRRGGQQENDKAGNQQ